MEAPPQGLPLRAEAAELEAPSKEEGGIFWWCGRRVKRSLSVTPQPTQTMFQTLTLKEGPWRESMTAPINREAQATLPCPQIIEIPNELGEDIS